MWRWRRRIEPQRFFLMAALALGLGACRVQPPPGPDEATPRELPHAFYRAAAEQGEAVYELDSAASRAVILVRRAGPLARFGHDHAIVARNLRGLLLFSPSAPHESRADLKLAVRDLDVDPPAERQRYELATRPSAKDIAATRDNLLQSVLVAEQWPDVYLRLDQAGGTPPQLRLTATLTLNAATRTFSVPCSVRVSRGELHAGGKFTLRQSEWGIEPFSTLGGALRVADAVEVEFELLARRVAPGGDGQKTKAPRLRGAR